jgi:hypothetical protein
MRSAAEKIGSGFVTDSRFSGLLNKPLFKKAKKGADGSAYGGGAGGKIQLDDRFKAHLNDLAKSSKKGTPTSVSKHGRKGGKSAKDGAQ